MPSTPAMYLASLESARKRSGDLRAGLAQGMQGIAQGGDRLAQLMAKLEGDKKAADALTAKNAKELEERTYNRGRDTAADTFKENERQDRLDQFKATTEKDLSKQTLDEDRIAADMNLRGFAQEDLNARSEADRLSREKIAADALAARKTGGGGGQSKSDHQWIAIGSDPKKAHLVPAAVWGRLFPGVTQPVGVPGGGTAKPLPAEMAEKRGLKMQALGLIPELRAQKAKVGTGPIEGPVKDLVGKVFSNPDRKKFLQTNNAVQRIAGRILEGGKLAEGDAKVYQRFILDPNSMDDDEYLAVLDSVEEFLKNDLSLFDAEMRSAGRAVGDAPAAAAPGDRAAKRAARIGEMKKQGMTREQANAALASEGLL